MNTQPLLVLATVPDVSHAETIARMLVDERCAACVTIGAPLVRPLYHSHGKTHGKTETPDEVGGLAPYLGWITAETKRSKAASIA